MQGLLQLEGDVELVDQHHLAAPGDEAEFLDPGGARFLHRVLDQRLVHHREHFLRHGLGGGQEAGSETGDRENGLLQRLLSGQGPLLA